MTERWPWWKLFEVRAGAERIPGSALVSVAVAVTFRGGWHAAARFWLGRRRL